MSLVSKGTEKIILYAIGALGLGGVYLVYKGAGVVSDNINLVNPADETNIINQGVSSVVSSATGGKSKSLGSYLFCLFNPDSVTCNPRAAVVNQSIDTSTLSTQQIDQLYAQEKEFINSNDAVAPGQPSFRAPTPEEIALAGPDAKF